MSREVRRVPMDWQHPMEWRRQWDPNRASVRMMLVPRPLYGRDMLRYFDETEDERPAESDVMPDFSGIDPDLLGYCMYETTSEGTPISPVMASPESLARWLADNEASAFGGMPASYEQWLSTCRTGWAPSAVVSSSGLESGVSFAARTER